MAVDRVARLTTEPTNLCLYIHPSYPGHIRVGYRPQNRTGRWNLLRLMANQTRWS